MTTQKDKAQPAKAARNPRKEGAWPGAGQPKAQSDAQAVGSHGGQAKRGWATAEHIKKTFESEQIKPSGTVKQGRRPMFKPFLAVETCNRELRKTTEELERVRQHAEALAAALRDLLSEAKHYQSTGSKEYLKAAIDDSQSALAAWDKAKD